MSRTILLVRKLDRRHRWEKYRRRKTTRILEDTYYYRCSVCGLRRRMVENNLDKWTRAIFTPTLNRTIYERHALMEFCLKRGKK